MTIQKLTALLLTAMLFMALIPGAVAEVPVSGGSITVLGFEDNTFFPPASTSTSEPEQTAVKSQILQCSEGKSSCDTSVARKR